jgi:hypothetical protein
MPHAFNAFDEDVAKQFGGKGEMTHLSTEVSGTVTGEEKLDVTVNASSTLIDIAKRAEAAIRLAGQINSNGPGSVGRSSPDAAAPTSPRPPPAGASEFGDPCGTICTIWSPRLRPSPRSTTSATSPTRNGR